MTTSRAWLLTSLLSMVLAVGCRDQAVDPRQVQAANLLATAQGDEVSLHQAEQLLDAVLQQDPQRHTALALRANLHIQMRQYTHALIDISAAARLLPTNTQYGLLACFLAQRQGQAAQPCYGRVVALWDRQGESTCEIDLNCVIADLMADGPRAGQRRDRLLALPAAEAETQARHFILDDFNRERYLKSILP